MKKILKWIIPVTCIVLVASIGCGHLFLNSNKVPTEIKYIHSNTTVNTDDPREVIGSQAYVFVGLVEETHDYMTEKNKREFPQIVIDADVPHTECVVKVIKNIKGNLAENITFSFFKVGGTSEDLEYIQLYENDLIPTVGKYYIFTGYAHQDGTVTGGGPNGTIELESGINADNLESSKLYQEYVDAAENQVSFGKDLLTEFLAKADQNYGNGSYNEQIKNEILKEKANQESK